MKKLSCLLAGAALLLGPTIAKAGTLDLFDPLHGMICTGAGTGCSNSADNGSFTPLPGGQFTNWGFSISPGPSTGNLDLVVLVPTNGINTATFNIPTISDNGNPGQTATVFNRTTLFTSSSADLPSYLGLPNATMYSPTDNFSNASAGEPFTNVGFSGSFLAFTLQLTGIVLDDTSSTTLTNDFSFGSALPDGTVIVGLFEQLIDKKGNSVDNFVGTAASADLVLSQFGATPLPTSIVFMFTGLVGLIGLGRKWAIPL